MTSAAVESLLVLCGLGMGSTLPRDFKWNKQVE